MDDRSERIAELEQEIARQEQLVALLPADAVAPSRAEGQREIARLRDTLAMEVAKRDAAAAGKAWNGGAFRNALRRGQDMTAAIAAALA